MRHTSTALYFYGASKKTLHKPRVTFGNMLFKIRYSLNYNLQFLFFRAGAVHGTGRLHKTGDFLMTGCGMANGCVALVFVSTVVATAVGGGGPLASAMSSSMLAKEVAALKRGGLARGEESGY